MVVMVVVPLPLASALHHTWSWRAILEPFGRVPRVRDARCTLAEEPEIRTSRRSLGSLQGTCAGSNDQYCGLTGGGAG